MNSLDISLTKDSSLLLLAFHSPNYWADYRKQYSSHCFKNHHKKYEKQENLSLFMNDIL